MRGGAGRGGSLGGGVATEGVVAGWAGACAGAGAVMCGEDAGAWEVVAGCGTGAGWGSGWAVGCGAGVGVTAGREGEEGARVEEEVAREEES